MGTDLTLVIFMRECHQLSGQPSHRIPFSPWQIDLPGWSDDLTRQIAFDYTLDHKILADIAITITKNSSGINCRSCLSMKYMNFLCTEEIAFKIQLIFSEYILQIWTIEDEEWYT